MYEGKWTNKNPEIVCDEYVQGYTKSKQPIKYRALVFYCKDKGWTTHVRNVQGHFKELYNGPEYAAKEIASPLVEDVENVRLVL